MLIIEKQKGGKLGPALGPASYMTGPGYGIQHVWHVLCLGLDRQRVGHNTWITFVTCFKKSQNIIVRAICSPFFLYGAYQSSAHAIH